MSKMTPQEMARHIGNGLLSFPVTPFTGGNAFDEARYRSNLDWLCGYEVAGLFAAGGTGEFFSLSPAEVRQLRATCTQVRCSSCGAPVNIERDAACGYCHAPLAILDADAVQRTLDALSQKERAKPVPDPAAAIDAILAGQRTRRRLGRYEAGHADEGVDLVREVLGLLTIEL